MNTFVQREILDNSISGNKIFGGEINWIDGLYTDHFTVPHDAGTGGAGSIDGSAFTIGITDRIALVESSVIGAESLHVWASDFSGYAAVLQSVATQYGSLYLNSAGGPMVNLTANTSSYIYHLPKLVIGTTVEINSGYKFEVGNASWLGYIYGSYAGYNTAFINDLWIEDHTSVWASMKTYTQLIDYLATNALDGGGGPLLVDSLQEAADNISGWQMSQIANIQDTISTSKWYAVSELDQLVSIGSSVVFGNIDGADIAASGEVSGATMESGKYKETTGGRIFVSTMHTPIEGLHLSWRFPLEPGGSKKLHVKEGTCLDSTKEERITLNASITKNLDQGFTIGDDNGGRADGVSLSANTTYWVFVISNPGTGAADVGFDTSLTAVNLMASTNVVAGGFTKWQRLGSVRTGPGTPPDVDIVMFQDVAFYQYEKRPVVSGFLLTVSDVETPFDVYAGAQRLGSHVDVWIQAGNGISNNNNLSYAFYSNGRPTSLSNITGISSAVCPFHDGGSPAVKRLVGEIELSIAEPGSFICSIPTASGLTSSGFSVGGLKGIYRHASFTLYMYSNT